MGCLCTKPNVETQFGNGVFRLEDATIKTPMFSFNGLQKEAKIVKVYDGDTVHAVFEYNGALVRFKLRLAHIDSAEMTSKDPGRLEEAQVAKEYLSNLIMNKIVWVEFGKFGKYADRVLADIRLHKNDPTTVNQMMLDSGHAERYEGGTKRK